MICASATSPNCPKYSVSASARARARHPVREPQGRARRGAPRPVAERGDRHGAAAPRRTCGGPGSQAAHKHLLGPRLDLLGHGLLDVDLHARRAARRAAPRPEGGGSRHLTSTPAPPTRPAARAGSACARRCREGRRTRRPAGGDAALCCGRAGPAVRALRPIIICSSAVAALALASSLKVTKPKPRGRLVPRSIITTCAVMAHRGIASARACCCQGWDWRRLLARVTQAGTPGAGNGGAAGRQGVRTASSTSPYSPKCSRRISFVAGHGRPPRNRRRPLLSPLGAALPDGKRSRPLPHERPWLGVAVSRRTFLRSPPLVPPARPRVDPPSGVDGARFPANVLYRPNVRLRLP